LISNLFEIPTTQKEGMSKVDELVEKYSNNLESVGETADLDLVLAITKA